MRIPAGLLSFLGSTAPGAIPNLNDAPWNVPNVLQPIVEAIGPLYQKGQPVSGAAISEIWTSSGMTSIADTRAPGVGVRTTAGPALQQGQWDVTVVENLQLPISLTNYQLTFVLSTTTQQTCFGTNFSVPIISTNSSFSRKFRVAVPIGAQFQFFASLDNTGGALASAYNVFIMAEKLI